MVIYRPNGKASKGKEEEEDDDNDRDGDVALDHLGWRRSADRGRKMNDVAICVESFDRYQADRMIGKIKTRRGGQGGRPCTGGQQCVGWVCIHRSIQPRRAGSFCNTQHSFFKKSEIRDRKNVRK